MEVRPLRALLARSSGSHPGSRRSIVVPPTIDGVAFPVIRSRFETASPGLKLEELRHCCATSPPETAPRSACRFAARSRSSMQEEAWHSLIGTDGCSPAARTTTACATSPPEVAPA